MGSAERRTEDLNVAAKKTNTGAILLVLGIVAVVWFFLSQKKKPAASAGGGAYGGGGGGTPLFPGGNVRSGNVPGGGGASGGSIQLPSFSGPSLAQRIKALLGFVAQGNQQGMLLQSSNAYLPGLGVSPDLSIPLQPVSLFDVGQLAQPIPGFDTSSISPTDLSLSDSSIPYQPLDTGGIDPNSFLQTQDIQYAPSDGGIDTTAMDLSNLSIDTNPTYNFGLDSTAAYQGQYDLADPSLGGY